jgi:hypothetical protein
MKPPSRWATPAATRVKREAAGRENDGGVRRAAEGFDSGCVGGVTRLREGLAGDGQQTRAG